MPGLRGVVPRYTHIRYSGYDPQGNRIDREAHGFHAREVQKNVIIWKEFSNHNG